LCTGGELFLEVRLAPLGKCELAPERIAQSGVDRLNLIVDGTVAIISPLA
jgi:hypothetical protein